MIFFHFVSRFSLGNFVGKVLVCVTKISRQLPKYKYQKFARHAARGNVPAGERLENFGRQLVFARRAFEEGVRERWSFGLVDYWRNCAACFWGRMILSSGAISDRRN